MLLTQNYKGFTLLDEVVDQLSFLEEKLPEHAQLLNAIKTALNSPDLHEIVT